MNCFVRNSLSVLVLSGLVFAATAGSVQAQVSADDAVKFRQSGYTFINWNMGRIKAQVVDGTVPFNPDQVQAAANVIAAIANSGMGALYAPDTLTATGWKATRLKPNFFDEPEKVREVAVNFIQQANTLQEVAGTGDQEAIATQFGELVESCRSCHQNFRGD